MIDRPSGTLLFTVLGLLCGCHRSLKSDEDALRAFLATWEPHARSSQLGVATSPDFEYVCRLFADSRDVEVLSKDDVKNVYSILLDRGVVEVAIGKSKRVGGSFEVPFSGEISVPLDAKFYRGAFAVRGTWRIQTESSTAGVVIKRVEELRECGSDCKPHETPATLCLAQYLAIDLSRVAYEGVTERDLRTRIPATALAARERGTGATKYYYDHPQHAGPGGTENAREEVIQIFDTRGRRVVGFRHE